MKEITVEVTKDHIEAAIQWHKTTGSYDIVDNCIIQRALKDAFNAPSVTCRNLVAYVGSTEIELPKEAREVTGLSPEQWNTVEPFKFTVKLRE